MPAAPPPSIPDIEYTHPNHYTFVHDVAISMMQSWKQLNESETMLQQTKYAYFNPWVIVYMLGMGLAWTIIRSLVTTNVLKVSRKRIREYIAKFVCSTQVKRMDTSLIIMRTIFNKLF